MKQCLSKIFKAKKMIDLLFIIINYLESWYPTLINLNKDFFHCKDEEELQNKSILLSFYYYPSKEDSNKDH